MNVLLPADLQEFVAEKLRSGEFRSADDVIAYALDLMQNREERLATLAADVKRGFGELDRGEGSAWDGEDFRKRLVERHGQEP